MQDREIVDMYFERDESAIRHTSDKYGKPLMALSKNITENIQDAEECVNDTYLQAWNRIPPNRPDRLYAFLARITRNISLDVCEKRHAQKRSAVFVELTAELQECIPSRYDELDCDNAVLGDALDSFIRSLDSETRYIFVRRYFYSDSIKNISDNVGRKESNVAVILHRTREKLRKRLEKEGIEI